MYSQRELICEANPFTWMANKNVGDYVPKPLKPGPVKTEIGKGIKRGLGIAFNNPITRAASELQKTLIPGAGKTRQRIKSAASRIIGSNPQKFTKYGKVGRYYGEMKRKTPDDFNEPNPSVIRSARTNPQAKSNAKRLNRILTDGRKLVRTTINNKTSAKFGLVDNNGKLVVIFYPYTKLPPNPSGTGYVDDGSDKTNTDVGYITWNAGSNLFENFPQKLSSTIFVNEPNFIEL